MIQPAARGDGSCPPGWTRVGQTSSPYYQLVQVSWKSGMSPQWFWLRVFSLGGSPLPHGDAQLQSETTSEEPVQDRGDTLV